MNRDEILKKSKMEKKGDDERELSIYYKSLRLFYIAFFFIYIFFQIFELIFFKDNLVSICLGIIFWFCSSLSAWYSAIKIKGSVIWYVYAVLSTFVFIFNILLLILKL